MVGGKDEEGQVEGCGCGVSSTSINKVRPCCHSTLYPTTPHPTPLTPQPHSTLSPPRHSPPSRVPCSTLNPPPGGRRAAVPPCGGGGGVVRRPRHQVRGDCGGGGGAQAWRPQGPGSAGEGHQVRRGCRWCKVFLVILDSVIMQGFLDRSHNYVSPMAVKFWGRGVACGWPSVGGGG